MLKGRVLRAAPLFRRKRRRVQSPDSDNEREGSAERCIESCTRKLSSLERTSNMESKASQVLLVTTDDCTSDELVEMSLDNVPKSVDEGKFLDSFAKPVSGKPVVSYRAKVEELLAESSTIISKYGRACPPATVEVGGSSSSEGKSMDLKKKVCLADYLKISRQL